MIDLFDSETAAALWFANDSEDEAEGLLLTEVLDPLRARAVIEAVISTSYSYSYARATLDVGGVEVLLFTNEAGEEGAYALDGTTLLIGTGGAVVQTLAAEGPFMTDSAIYQRTVADLPSALGSYAYFDLAALFRLAEGGLPPELDDVERALDGLIINLVQENGISRVSGILSVGE